MQNSSLNNFKQSNNFIIMLVILFLMEFARGMYILSYLSLLPTATTIAVGITSTAISIHFISDAATNFVIGFLLKRFGSKIVLTSGFLLAFASLFLVIWLPTNPIVLIASAMLLGIAVSPIWVIMLASVEEKSRGKQMGYVLFCMVVRFTCWYDRYESYLQVRSNKLCIYDVPSCLNRMDIILLRQN
jgi:MFS family permease